MSKLSLKLNIHEAKTNLSQYLLEVEKGGTIILCRHNVPIAEIRGLPKKPLKKRPIGLEKSKFVVPDTFFEPLPPDLLNLFAGLNS